MISESLYWILHTVLLDLAFSLQLISLSTSGVPRNFVLGGGSTNSVEDRGQRERGSAGVAP